MGLSKKFTGYDKFMEKFNNKKRAASNLTGKKNQGGKTNTRISKNDQG